MKISKYARDIQQSYVDTKEIYVEVFNIQRSILRKIEDGDGSAVVLSAIVRDDSADIIDSLQNEAYELSVKIYNQSTVQNDIYTSLKGRTDLKDYSY